MTWEPIELDELPNCDTCGRNVLDATCGELFWESPDEHGLISCQSCLLDSVWKWIRGEADQPSDSTIAAAVTCIMNEWVQHRKSGMDVLATCSCDNAVQIIKAIRDK